MKRFCSLLSLVLVICMVVSGCQSKPAKTVPDSGTSVSATDTDSSDLQPEAVLSGSEGDKASKSTSDELINAAGDAPPQYDGNTTFTLENGVLTANGDPVPKNITELDLCHAEFPDYRFLEDFTDLEKLDLSNSSISDVSVLSGLTNLKRLSLADSPVLDLSPIKCLPNLWLLDVSATGIDFDFQGWSCQDTLEVLYLYSTETSTLADIHSFPHLLELWAWNIPATDFSDLSALENMESMILSCTALEDLSVLSGMTRLRTLDISDTNVSDFSLITKDNFPNLTTLSVAVPESQAAEIASAYPSLTVQNFYAGE